MSLPFSRQNGPSSLSPYERCSSLLIIFAILCWTPTNKSMSCFYSEAQNWTHLHQEERKNHWTGRILMQLGILFASRVYCWLLLLFPRTLRPLGKLLSSWWAPRIHGCLRIFLPVCRALQFFLNSLVFPSATLWLAQAPLKDGTIVCCAGSSSLFCILSEVAEAALCPIVQVISADIEQPWAHQWTLRCSTQDLPSAGPRPQENCNVNMHNSPVMQQSSLPIVEVYQVGQGGFPLPESKLTIPSQFPELHLCGNTSQEYFLLWKRSNKTDFICVILFCIFCI